MIMIRKMYIDRYLLGFGGILKLPGCKKMHKNWIKERMKEHFVNSDLESQKMIVFYYLVKFSKPEGWQSVRLAPPSDAGGYPRLKLYSSLPEDSTKHEKHFEQHQTVCSLAFGNFPTKNGLLAAFEGTLKDTGLGRAAIEKEALDRFEKLYASDLRKLFS